MAWLTAAILEAILSWLMKFFMGLWEGYQTMRGNGQTNGAIKERVEGAQTPQEIQEALNEAASHLGRRGP